MASSDAIAPALADLHWSDVLASISEALIVFGPDARVFAVNPVAETLLDSSEALVRGKHLEELCPPAGHNAWLVPIVVGTLRDGTVQRHGEAWLARHGKRVLVSATCGPLHDRAGAVRGAVLVLRDLTLERALDDTTRRADRLTAFGSVVLGLAHEIRNPLSGIKGAARLLEQELVDPGHRRCTEIIVREVDRLEGLVAQLNALREPRPLRRVPVNIHRVLQDVLNLQQRTPDWGAVVLRAAFDPSLPPVLGDADQLTQVFLNLVRNALEAMGGRGELHVSTRVETGLQVRLPEGTMMLASVIIGDTGPGVPADVEPLLFAPFFSTKARGSGLGLPVCHRIVTEHAGTIAYEPRAGGGASFRVTLPLAPTDDHLDH
ncbi:MAG TPA: ATP-binding protein [Candidatus Limnocylindria bacterium]|nr:ATP-binding protein [Candidatus Limnocylindria bacterium]